MTEKTEIWKDATPSLDLLDQTFSNATDNIAVDTPILVAIDTESSHQGRLSELGISIFDPLCLCSKNDNADLLNSRIATYYYAKSGSKKRCNYKPYRLGTPQPRLRNGDIQQILHTYLTPRTLDGNPRQVILIGHYIDYDLHAINECSGFNPSQNPHITAILDTHIIARPILDTNRVSLKHILQDMKLDYIGLHNAGHDSRYTLRAALMLFVLYKQQQQSEHIKYDDRSSNSSSSSSNSMNRLIAKIARCHKINERIKWTTSTRVKPVSPGLDIFPQDIEDGGIMASLI